MKPKFTAPGGEWDDPPCESCERVPRDGKLYARELPGGLMMLCAGCYEDSLWVEYDDD